MLFNGLSTFCIFPGDQMPLDNGYIDFETTFTTTYADTSLIGKSYVITSLYDGIIRVYLGYITSTTVSLCVDVTIGANTLTTKRAMYIRDVINKPLSMKYSYTSSRVSLTINDSITTSKEGVFDRIVTPTTSKCYIGAQLKKATMSNYFYGSINAIKLNNDESDTPILDVDLEDIKIEDGRLPYIPAKYPEVLEVGIYGIIIKKSFSIGIDRIIVREAPPPVKVLHNSPIDRDIYLYGDVTYNFGIDRAIRIGVIYNFGVNRSLYECTYSIVGINRLVVKRDLIPLVHIYNESVTKDQMDGTMVSYGDGSNPIYALKTSPNASISKPIKLAVRCASNYTAHNGVTLVLLGDKKNYWQLSLDNNDKPGTFNDFGEPLVISSHITDTNTIFWARYNPKDGGNYDDTTNIRIDGKIIYGGEEINICTI